MTTKTALVKNADRMMTQAAIVDNGIAFTFADGRSGILPYPAVIQGSSGSKVIGIELPNPYEVNVKFANGEKVELPWDFVRHYCDDSYKPRIASVAANGKQYLGRRIKAFREAAGLTQVKLASAAGISRITEVRIENGDQSPRYETIIAIANALNRQIGEIIAGE